MFGLASAVCASSTAVAFSLRYIAAMMCWIGAPAKE